MALQIEITAPGAAPRLVVAGEGRTRVIARPTETYRLIDDTGAPLKGATAKRVDNSLLIEGLPDGKEVEINNFFAAGSTGRDTTLMLDSLGAPPGSTLTQDSEMISALSDGSFLMYGAASSAPPLAPVAGAAGAGGASWGTIAAAAAGGLLLVGAAAGGGGGGGGGSSTPVVDTTPPPAPTFTTAAATNDRTPVLSGTAEAGTQVTVRVDLNGNGTADAGDVTYRTTAAADGTWSVDTGTATPILGALPVGGLASGVTYIVLAQANDASGNISPLASTQISIDTSAPTAPTITSAALTNLAMPVIGGSAEPGATVTLSIDASNNGSVDAVYRTTASAGRMDDRHGNGHADLGQPGQRPAQPGRQRPLGDRDRPGRQCQRCHAVHDTDRHVGAAAADDRHRGG